MSTLAQPPAALITLIKTLLLSTEIVRGKTVSAEYTSAEEDDVLHELFSLIAAVETDAYVREVGATAYRGLSIEIAN